MAISTIGTNSLGASQVTPAKLSQPLTQGTAVASTSGTSIDFTGIPSWVKRITVMFNGVSTSGASAVQIQLGTSGGVETTGYAGAVTSFNASTLATENSTTGVQTEAGSTKAATSVRNGAIVFSLLGSNGWSASGSLGLSGFTNNSFVGFFKTLSGQLDRLRITTVNGTDTFDAGSINIMYEG